MKDDRVMPGSTASTENAGALSTPRAQQYRAAGWWTGERLAERFARHVVADPQRTAVVDDRGHCLSRQQLWESAAHLSEAFRSRGLGPGEVVVVYLPNWVQWQVTVLACLQLGAVPATLPITTDLDKLRHIAHLVGARAIVGARSYRRRPTGRWIEQVAASLPRCIAMSVGDDGSEVWHPLGSVEVALRVPKGIDHLMFTSSTTGMPKAVMHTADTLAAANRAVAERFGIDETTPIFMPSPLGHSVGAWHGGRLSLYTGAPLVLQDRWDAERALRLVDEHGCVFTSAATPYLQDLLLVAERVGGGLGTLRSFICGGAPVPPSLLEAARKHAPSTFVTVLWGMTEGTGTTCTTDSSVEQLTKTAGRPLDGLELTILQPDENGVGELAMRGPSVFLGYLGQEETYRGLLTADGWFRTGDQARIDDDGYVWLTGRLKDLIIRGGVNVAPGPIEDAIAAHPNVRAVAVIGAPDERLGERICAVIVPLGTPPTFEELIAWLKKRGLSERNLPELLRTVEQMPVTAAGKIRKVDLRSQIRWST